MTEYRFRGWCSICREGSEWFEKPEKAGEWRQSHFDTEHAENPMWRQNTATQRYPVDDIGEVR